MYVSQFRKVFLRCPTPRLHCFLYSHWPPFRFLSFMVFLIPSIQFFFGLPRVLFCFGIHFNAILGNFRSAILWTWTYHLSWFCSISFIIRSSNQIWCLIVTFLILIYLFIYLLQLGCHPVAVVIFTCKQNMKSVTNKFKSGGLHEKRVVATWNVGNRLSVCL